MERNVAQNKTNACSIPIVDLQPLGSTNIADIVPPEVRHLNRQTDGRADGHKSRFSLCIGRGERLGRVGSTKTAIVVKNRCCLAGARQQSQHFFWHIKISFKVLIMVLYTLKNLSTSWGNSFVYFKYPWKSPWKSIN